MTAALPAAFSLSGRAQEYGAYAGFASILGLAVLSLLYFAQAREVKRLRDWAGRAPERAQESEARIVAGIEARRAAPAAAPRAAPARPRRPRAPRPPRRGPPQTGGRDDRRGRRRAAGAGRAAGRARRRR